MADVVIRPSDADRDDAAEALADAVSSGRLSLAEHNARLDALFAALSTDQLLAVTADLPARPVRRGALFRAFDMHRCIVIGGHAQRAGRYRLGRFITVVAVFGGLDLDLRAVALTQDRITIRLCSVGARVSITVPAGWQVNDQALVLGPRQAIRDSERDGGGPLLRLHGLCAAGSFRLSQE